MSDWKKAQPNPRSQLRASERRGVCRSVRARSDVATAAMIKNTPINAGSLGRPARPTETDINTSEAPSSKKKTRSTTAAAGTEEARRIAEKLGLNFARESFDLEQFRMGLDVELEHGRRDPATNVTDDDPTRTGKIALAHLRELPYYYTRLAEIEAKGGS